MIPHDWGERRAVSFAHANRLNKQGLTKDRLMVKYEGEGEVQDVFPIKAASRAVQLGMARDFDNKEFGQSLLLAVACGQGVLQKEPQPIGAIGSDEQAASMCEQCDLELRAASAGDEAKNTIIWGILSQLLMWWMNRK